MKKGVLLVRQQFNNKEMNITTGQSSQKEHLSNGSRTSCNRKTSGIGKNDFNSFAWYVNNYPEVCCQICLNRYKEKIYNNPNHA